MAKSLFTKSKPKKGLVSLLPKTAARDASGIVTVRHRGSRQKRYYRHVDFKRNKHDVSATVMSLEYDPNRNAHIQLVSYDDGESRYIIAPHGLHVGDKIVAGNDVEIKVGNAMPLGKIPVGIEVHNIEMRPGQGGTFVRSAGSSAVVVARDGGYVTVKLASGEVRKVDERSWATVGRVSNITHKDEIIGKAGRKRLMGWRPEVRGTAMNPRSHPHGGGEGRTGEGMHPKTPWGKPARGKRTRNPRKWTSRLIISRRKGSKK